MTNSIPTQPGRSRSPTPKRNSIVQSEGRPWGPASRALREEGVKTLADEAYQKIREDIIQARFAPGEKLQPDILKERYDIGLSPVREALSRLARDGLATAEGQRGFFVAPASLGELLDVTDLRIHLSIMAVERSIKFGDDAWENGVVTAYYQLDKTERQMKRDPVGLSDEWERRNREFHRQLESGCESPWLLHFGEVLYDQLERYRRLYSVYVEHGPAVHEEHRAIMEAVLARKADVARDLLAKHFAHARQVVLDRMNEPGGKKTLPRKIGKPAAVRKRATAKQL